MGDERVLGHAVNAVNDFSVRLASGISQASEKPCDVIPSAALLLVHRLAKAMHAVSSTIAAGPSCSSSRADSSSVTVGGVFVMAFGVLEHVAFQRREQLRLPPARHLARLGQV